MSDPVPITLRPPDGDSNTPYIALAGNPTTGTNATIKTSTLSVPELVGDFLISGSSGNNSQNSKSNSSDSSSDSLSLDGHNLADLTNAITTDSNLEKEDAFLMVS